MNHKIIRYILFRLITLIGLLMILPTIVAIIYSESKSFSVFLGVLITCIIVGSLGSRKKPENIVFYAKEGFVVTSLSWILLSVIGAIPFYLTGTIPNFVDALFETVSGFTTTGASILTAVDGMDYSVQFWRTFSHWIGGMGVLVFMIAIVPLADGYSMHLMRAEAPGPIVGKFVPKVKDTAKILYLIYFGITLVEIIALKISGLTLYESITLTFSTVGTGGFAVTNAGIGGYPIVSQAIIIIFMALCGVNFSVYYFLITKRPKEALRCDEMRWYFGVMMVSASLIAVNIYRAGITQTPFLSFHHAMFTTVSIMTTTGFGTLDFNVWPQFSRTLLFLLTLLGACAGSTGGGFKFSRLLIIFRTIKNELSFVVHPRSVKKVYMDGHSVESTTVKSVFNYLGIYLLIMCFSILLISMDGFSFETNVTAVAATLNNVGPGLGMVGTTGNFSQFSAFSKIVMMFDMLAGRLELLPMLILLSYKTWKK
ncbi:MAG: TrkH family potassium uptake protein [Butyrivibrio sp.]|nr:TrkH family potassium uptake protein [Butyrivibrio sp.]